jgi:hypothetical protein
VHWLQSTQNGSGYWVSQGGPNVDSTGVAAAGLNGYGVATPAARTWLAHQQVTTGPTIGAGASRGALAFEGHYDPPSEVKATSDGTLGLSTNASLATLTDAGATPDTAVLALAAPTLTARQVRQGATDTVTGTGFSQRETVTVTLAGRRVGSAAADANGTAALTLRVPISVAPGSAVLTLTGASSGLSSATTLLVRPAAAPSSSSSATPRTPRSNPTAMNVAPAPTSTAPTTPPAAPVLAATGAPGVGTLLSVGVGSLLLGAAALVLGRRRRT